MGVKRLPRPSNKKKGAPLWLCATPHSEINVVAQKGVAHNQVGLGCGFRQLMSGRMKFQNHQPSRRTHLGLFITRCAISNILSRTVIHTLLSTYTLLLPNNTCPLKIPRRIAPHHV